MENEKTVKEEEVIEKKPEIKKKDIHYQKPWSRLKDFLFGVGMFIASVVITNNLLIFLPFYAANYIPNISMAVLLAMVIALIVKGRRFIAFGMLLFPLLILTGALLLWGACYFSMTR
jgi:hypothetical protein